MPEITEKMLIAQLRELEADGIIARTSYGEVPPRVEYALTPHGRELKPVLEAMRGWGQEHIRLHGLEAPTPPQAGADGGPRYVWPDPAAAG